MKIFSITYTKINNTNALKVFTLSSLALRTWLAQAGVARTCPSGNPLPISKEFMFYLESGI